MQRRSIFLFVAIVVVAVAIGVSFGRFDPSLQDYEPMNEPGLATYATPVVIGPQTREDEYFRTHAAYEIEPVRLPASRPDTPIPLGTPTSVPTQ